MRKPAKLDRDGAETLAVQALTFLASEPARLGRFLALSGIGPEQIRAAAASPGFMAGVLDHVAADEALLIEFAGEANIAPGEVERARRLLSNQRPVTSDQTHRPRLVTDD